MTARKFIFLILILFFFHIPASAQFYLPGTNPASVRWNFIESPNYKVIYPAGLDSLARIYALNLEKYRIPVSRTVGYVPGEMTSVRMPAVLHAFNAMSNGSVAWAPKRMDLYTSPSAYYPEPIPWSDMLAVHESRHVAQLQFGLSHWFRPFKYVFGEMFCGLLAGLYPNDWLLEGDAVVAETGLSMSGRGRTADFLNYYRIAFDNGDFRNFDKWAHGSYRYYAPNHYAFGYMLLSGMRYLYDVPDISGQMFRHFARRPFDFAPNRHVVRQLTGTGFYEAADSVMMLYSGIWAEDMESRAPFLPYTKLGRMQGNYTEYTGNLAVGDNVYSLKESFRKSRRLTMTDNDGQERNVGMFGGTTGRLRYSPALEKIIFSETVPDVRWSQKYNSVIRSVNPDNGRKRNITVSGRIFNPFPFPDDGRIAAAEYSDDGRSRLVIIDGESGKIRSVIPVPDTLQLVEPAVLGNTIYASCISGSGYGIYSTDLSDSGSGWTERLSPSPVMISNLDIYGSRLIFSSDRTGTKELYALDTVDGKVYRKTSTKYGAADFTFSDDGKYLFCSMEGIDGKNLVRISTDSLLNEEVDFHERYRYVIADRLSEQERELAEKSLSAQPQDPATQPEISAPKRYRKIPNGFNIHSWAPFYFNYDNLSDMSFDKFYNVLSLGASGFFQNNLGTLYGNLGYSAHKDPYDKSRWRHSGHLNLTYSGLYPVFEARIDFNDRASRTSAITKYFYGGQHLMTTMTSSADRQPYVSGKFSVYVPFNFSSGGWSRGLIPQISYTVSNDVFDKGAYMAAVSYDNATQEIVTNTVGKDDGDKVIRQVLSASLRYYTILNQAHSEIYPDFGIGLESGAFFNPGLTDIVTSSAYLYAYGYLPGITGTQGIKLTALYRRQLFMDKVMFASEGVNMLPRGLGSENSLMSYTASHRSVVKLSADYAIPFYLGDFRIGHLFYFKRAVLTPHFDIALAGKEQLWSAGTSLAIDLDNIFGISFPVSIGVSYSYNGGQEIGRLEKQGMKLRHHFEPVFSISF